MCYGTESKRDVQCRVRLNRERDNAWYDRGDLPVGGIGAAGHLHAGGVARLEFTMKRRDPIIDELHRVREDIGREHDFDVYRIATKIRRLEDQSSEGVVRESPKRATRQKKTS